jgi:DNA polymerase-3 subunit delta'
VAFDRIRSSQPHVVQLLENSLKKDRLSHAYLFEGEKGTKKFDTAVYFAQMLLCTSEENKPCLHCKNCRRVHSGVHPNVYIVEPVNNNIRKQQIQDLQMEFAKTSIEPGKKIYIIKDIDTINVAAANSLLKFLEEPYPDIHGILTTNNINKLLPTIISRSQIVSFQSLNKNIIEEDLREAGYDHSTARIIAQLTNSVEDAIEIASTEYFLDIMDAVTDLFKYMVSLEQSLVLYFNENHSIIYQDKDVSHLFLACMILYQKDIIHMQQGDLAHIIFHDEAGTIEQLAALKTKNRLIRELENMLSLKGKLNHYINERLAYDNLLLDLERR